jgi:hypothetical protein
MSAGSNENGGNLQSKYEFNSTWADRIAHLILIGLAVDIIAAFVLGKSPLEVTLSITASVLIALGVWGELWFARRAKEAGDGIVAEAKARALEAKLELARLEKKSELEIAELKKETTRLEVERAKLEIQLRSLPPAPGHL